MTLGALDVGFLAPDVLVGLVGVVLIAAALLARGIAIERLVTRIVGPRRGDLRESGGRPHVAARAGVFAVGAALAVVALARPTWGHERSLVTPNAVDLVVALDVSRSMLARDVSPSRLERAKTLLRGLAGRIASDRIGLVVFAGDARLLVPLTQDMESFAELLDEADPAAVERGGTDLGAAITTALESLPDAAYAGTSARAIVLMSDGEDLTGEGLNAARRCAERGVTVHAIGLGTARGGKIPVPLDGAPAKTGVESYLADRAGRDVVSVLDPQGLSAIAAATGGTYVEGGVNAAALEDMIERVDRTVLKDAKTRVEERQRGERRLVYQWPLLLACLLWVFELVWLDRKTR